MEFKIIALALGANLSFATGSQFFTHFTRRHGTYWMNWFKASVALVFFVAWILITSGITWPGLNPVGLLFISGILGLGIADLCLLQSFKELGPGRTLMLFSFQPLISGTAGHIFFNQGLDLERFWAIFFFILCVFIFSIESFRKDKHWAISGISLALLGMCLDTTGIIITRSVFEQNPALSPMTSNLYRTIGAVAFFFLFSFKNKRRLLPQYRELSRREKIGVIFGAFLGTFLSLSLYLAAVQYAHLATLAAIAITSAIFSTLLECIWEKRWPSPYLWSAFVSFLIGMYILLF